MAMGLGQSNGDFTSPDPVNGYGWDALAGFADDHPAVAGPTVGGFGTNAGDTGLVHIGTGGGSDQHASHWSELYNLDSPLPWLLLLSVVYFGLINLSVSARVGR